MSRGKTEFVVKFSKKEETLAKMEKIWYNDFVDLMYLRRDPMKQDRITYLANILFPCVVFSVVTGGLTGGLIFLFRFAASHVADWASVAYEWVRHNPLW